MKLNLSLDVEDVFGNQAQLNYILEELCVFCEQEHLYCDLYITGIKFKQLQEEHPALLEYLNKSTYLEVGYHSNTHSFITIPEMTNKVEGKENWSISSFEEQDYNFATGEFNGAGGIVPMAEFFSPGGFRAPNYAWTPEYLEYIKGKGLRVHTMDIEFYKPYYFMDMLHLPVVSKPLEAMLTMDEVAERCKPYQAASIFLHPSRILYDQFWDKQKVREESVQWRERLDTVKRIFKSLQNNYELIGLGYLQSKYNQTPKIEFDRQQAEELLLTAMTKKWTWSQLPKGFYNKQALVSCKRYVNTFFVSEL